MKAFIVDRYGSKDGLRAGEMPDPEVREDDGPCSGGPIKRPPLGLLRNTEHWRH